MESHRYNGAIHSHYKKTHDRKPTTQELMESSSVLHRVTKYNRLAITEAVSIELRKPLLNVQREFDLVLPSCRRRKRQTDTHPEEPLPPSPHPSNPHYTRHHRGGERGRDNYRLREDKTPPENTPRNNQIIFATDCYLSDILDTNSPFKSVEKICSD